MDLTPLRPVLEAPGPYATLHLEVGRTDVHGAEQQDARWRAAEQQLVAAGLPDEVVQEVGRRVTENTRVPGEARRTVVASAAGVLLDDVQVGHTHRAEVVDVAELPDLAPWLTAADGSVPFLLVVADRLGADLAVHRATRAVADATEQVEGETFYVTKVPQGDWAQKQFQQTAEDSWVHNARLVAGAATSLVRSHRPGLVLVAGEVRARSEVVKAMEREPVEVRVEQVESGGRGAGASEEALWDEVRARVTAYVRKADADVAAALDEGRGRGEGAATGLEEVVDALAKSQVDRLVLDLDALADQRVRADRLEAVGLPAPAARADDLPADRALVAAAALTGAHLTLLPAGMSRGCGVAALLRWSDTAPAEPTDTV